jgi:ankyrin repeat protein
VQELESKESLYDQTALSLAAENGHEAVVKLLVEQGAELESEESSYNWTPLSYVAIDGHEALVKLLLDQDAELESEDINGRTPLSLAAKEWP